MFGESAEFGYTDGAGGAYGGGLYFGGTQVRPSAGNIGLGGTGISLPKKAGFLKSIIAAIATLLMLDMADEKAEAKKQNKEPTVIFIYRFGRGDPTNLTPDEEDVNLFPSTGMGLSFSLKYKPGSAVTTIEAINSTGILYARKDKGPHVSVFPVGATLEEWYIAGPDSIWTKALQSVIIN